MEETERLKSMMGKEFQSLGSRLNDSALSLSETATELSEANKLGMDLWLLIRLMYE